MFEHLDDTTFDPDDDFRDRVDERVDRIVRRRRTTMLSAMGATVAIVATAGFVAMRQDDSITSPSSQPTTLATPPPSTVPSTVPTVTTPAPPTTAPASTATTAAPAIELRADGLGVVEFGAPLDVALPALVAAFGEPASDSEVAYPVERDDGTFADESGQIAFVSPTSRHICFLNGLCATFDAFDAPSPRFVGWTLYQPSDPDTDYVPPRTASGVTAGSVLADHLDAFTFDERACFTTGYGHVDGVDAQLESTVGTFGSYDQDTLEYTWSLPDPAGVVVWQLQAGTNEVSLVDC